MPEDAEYPVTSNGVLLQGLWGPGSAFADFEAFLASMKKRGVSFLEMLSMEMKVTSAACNSNNTFSALASDHVLLVSLLCSSASMPSGPYARWHCLLDLECCV